MERSHGVPAILAHTQALDSQGTLFPFKSLGITIVYMRVHGMCVAVCATACTWRLEDSIVESVGSRSGRQAVSVSLGFVFTCGQF